MAKARDKLLNTFMCLGMNYWISEVSKPLGLLFDEYSDLTSTDNIPESETEPFTAYEIYVEYIMKNPITNESQLFWDHNYYLLCTSTSGKTTWLYLYDHQGGTFS